MQLFDSPEGPRRISPLESLSLGLFMSLLVGFTADLLFNALCYLVGLDLLTVKTSVSAHVVLASGIGVMHYTWCLQEVPVGSQAVQLLFGKRREGRIYTEGVQYALWPIMGLYGADVRKDTLDLKDTDTGVFTEDRVQVGVIGTMPVQVKNVFAYSNVMDGKAKEFVKGKLEAAIRSVIKAKNLEDLLKMSKADLTRAIKEAYEASMSVAETERDWGLWVGDLQVQDVVILDEEIIRALSGILRESLEQKSELIQARARAEQASQYAQHPRWAVTAALVDAGKPGATMKDDSFTLAGLEVLSGAIGNLSGAITAAINQVAGKRQGAKP